MADTHEVDTRGFFCPIPVAMVSRKMNSLVTGDRLTVYADDGEFKNDIAHWTYETGNTVLDMQKDGNGYRVEIQRGEGFHGETLRERVKFIATGVKLHAIAMFYKILPVKKIRYLLTFSSVNEGLRADQWLQSLDKEGRTGYVTMPVPDDITDHCGVVFGLTHQEEAEDLYNLLQKNRFVVEGIYQKDNHGQFKPVK